MAAFLLLFLVFLSTLCSAQQNPQTLSEVQALTSFKLRIHDPLTALSDWDSSSPFAPCDWRGVFCVNGKVSELRLPHLQLTGPLTNQIGNLRMLRKLSLRSNSFNGTVPASLSKCTLLHSVFLQGNAFSGKLPVEIFNLTDLQVFNVAGNQLSGEIPGEVPRSLRYFDLSSNLFTGDIPRYLSDLSQLLLINLSYNRFSGEIPASIGRLQQLQYLWLAYNDLVGTLPSAIANCSSLVHLSAEGNAIRGVIPAAIAALPKLQVISLSHNNLSGSLPASLFCNVSIYPPSLRIVQLGFNGFTDIVKQESAKCFSSLQILDLQHNQIHGEFPLILTNNSALTSLDVSWNLFSGKIPSAIGNLWRLELLRMGNNSFEAGLPFEITNCSSLKVLDLEGNRMTGKIPMFLVIAMIKVDFIYSGVSIHSNNNTTVSAFKQQDALHHCTYSNGKIERTFSWSHTGKRQLQNLQSPVEHTMCDEKGKEKERRRCT
ncbi:putative LRR receptor-like serine/threonine-protein kinase [Capsicum annuum]|nr:putative LRR receptor-like serine/threonine-protein kinase [Capsicum annuum]